MKKILLILSGVLLVGILVGYGTSWYFQQSQKTPEQLPVVVTEEITSREIQLYFTAPAGDFLVAESYEIPACDQDSDCIRSLLDGLINGSRQGNLPVLPKETQVVTVEVINDLVRIDFSRQLVDFHPGGSLSELLSVYSLINSINENFPYIRQLQIVVEGEVEQTLKGHVRIDQPIYPDFSYSEAPRPGLFPEQPESEAAGNNLSIEEILEGAESGGDK
jgi:hypothetical protein